MVHTTQINLHHLSQNSLFPHPTFFDLRYPFGTFKQIHVPLSQSDHSSFKSSINLFSSSLVLPLTTPRFLSSVPTRTYPPLLELNRRSVEGNRLRQGPRRIWSISWLKMLAFTIFLERGKREKQDGGTHRYEREYPSPKTIIR